MKPDPGELMPYPGRRQKSGWRTALIIALCLVLGITFIEIIGSRSLVRSVSIRFDWSRVGGFRNISAELPVGSIYNRLLILQAEPRIASELQAEGWRSAKGRLNVRVVCGLFVLGLDHYNAWNAEIIDPEVAPLMRAVDDGDTTSVKGLIAEGANVNAQDQRGWTALMHASMKGRETEVALLLSAGADPNITDRNGRTAFLWAAWNCRSDVAVDLIEAGADVNVKDKFGSSAISSTPCPGVVQNLLTKTKVLQRD